MRRPNNRRWPVSDVEAEAAAWAVRLDAGALDEADRARLNAWLAGGRQRRGALLRAQAGLRFLEQGRRDEEVLRPPARRSRSGLRRLSLPVAAAAAAVLVCSLLLLLPLRGEFRTGLGEQRRVALQDGSVAFLNTDSRVDVRFAEHRRGIALARGEAWFQVAKDHSRPFVVDAGTVRVRATGTAFAVRREAAGVEVVVTEGRVLVWREDQPATALAVSSGQATFVSTRAPAPPRAQAAHVEDLLAWRRGEIVLNGETVAAAADEFNRYNDRKLVLADPAAGQEKIVGYFLIDQPEKFAIAVARMTGARVRNDARSIVIESSQ